MGSTSKVNCRLRNSISEDDVMSASHDRRERARGGIAPSLASGLMSDFRDVHGATDE